MVRDALFVEMLEGGKLYIRRYEKYASRNLGLLSNDVLVRFKESKNFAWEKSQLKVKLVSVKFTFPK